MSSLSVSMETCSWDSVTVGSQCEWSDEESNAPAAKLLSTPTRVPPPQFPNSDPDPSPVSCDWSEHEESGDAVRRSLRNRKRKKLFDPSPASLRPTLPSPLACASFTCSSPISEVDWNLFSAMETYGCQENCISTVHGQTEYDVLLAHSGFASKTTVEQRRWIFDYLATHCPNDDSGRKDVKNTTFLVCAKSVCLTAWLAVLSISSSRFYEIRKEFVNGQTEPTPKRPRSMSVKSQQAIAWMSSYFKQVGDKRPDKDGIYLPTCLTEKAIHSRMIQELYREEESQAVCLSQFNRLFRTNFPNVTIPKVGNCIHAIDNYKCTSNGGRKLPTLFLRFTCFHMTRSVIYCINILHVNEVLKHSLDPNYVIFSTAGS